VREIAASPHSARAQRPHRRVLVVGDRAEHHAGCRHLAPQLLADRDTAEVRIADIDQYEVGVDAANSLDRLLLARRLGGDHELSRRADALAHRATRKRVAIDQNEPNDVGGPGGAGNGS
jgi:hypothetical protein